MFRNTKSKLTGDRKILILFLILVIFNLALYIILFNYMFDISKIDMLVLEDFITINSALIILGFTTTRLPKYRKKRSGAIYELTYFIILGLLSITVSFFNEATNSRSIWMPFIEMFKMLSVMLILTYVATKSKSFKAIARGDHSRKAIAWQIVICSILGVLASYLTLDINGVPANARGLVVMISAMLGGPYVGIPVGIISGLWRFSMGGSTAAACCIGTILAGIVGGIVHRWNGNQFLSTHKAVLLMFLYSGFDMFLITALTPSPDGLIYASTLYGPMTFAAVFGMFLFSLFLDEKREEKTADDDDCITEMSRELNECKAKADEAGRELEEHRNRIEELERELGELKESVGKKT